MSIRGFMFLASPFSRFPGGHDAAYEGACYAAGVFLGAGFNVFSPIAHSAGIAKMMPHLGTDHLSWQALNETMLAHADALVVICLQTWRNSEGVNDEIAFARKHHKPTTYWRLGDKPPGVSLNLISAEY